MLINDQYNLTDTNKITIVSNSFKVGANYTVVTVSGIGSVGTGVFPNPVYPEAGIAVSTGSAWASSVPNNSSNWNIAFNDKITNAAFSGTNTKTLTLTQYDGETFTPTFTDLQGVTGVTAGTGLTGGTITSTGTVAVDFTTVAPLANPTFTGTVSGITKSMVGLGNVDNTSDANKPVSTATQTALDGKQNTLTNPVTGTGTTNTLPLFTGSSTLGNSVVQQSSNNIGINTTPFASLTLAQGKNIMLDASSNNIPRILFYESNARNENDVQFGSKIQYNSPSDRLEFIMRDSFSADPSGDELAISITRQTGNTTIHKDLTVTGNITEAGNNVLTSADTTSMLLPYLRKADTTNMLLPYFRDADTTSLNLTSRFAAKLNLSDTASMLSNYNSGINLKLNISDTASMLTNYLRKLDTVSLSNRINLKFNTADTSLLNLTSRFNTKQNTLSGTGFVKASGTNITYDNSSYLRTGLADSTYLKLTGGTLTGGLTGTSINLSSTINSTGDIFLGSNSQYSGLKTRYFKTTDISPNRDLFIGSVGTLGTWAGRMHFQTSYNTETPTIAMTINEFGNINMNGTLNATGATTLGSTLAVTGNITESGNNVLTNLDTVSLSNRINAINSGGNQIANNNNSTQTISNLGGLSNYYLWINNPNTVTITLPSPSLNNNKMITIKNTDNGAVFSASSNVQPLINPTPPATLVNTNVILASGGGKWTTMVSNGFEWVKMAGN